MIKKLAIFAMATMMVFAFAGVASASQLKNAANNQVQCEKVGGHFVAGPPNTCVITTNLEPEGFEGVVTKTAGINTWTVDGSKEQSEEVVVSKSSGPGVVGEPTIIPGDTNVTHCYKNDTSIDPTNPNCQLP